MQDEKVQGDPTYHGFRPREILEFCRTNGENTTITDPKDAIMNLHIQIERWDMSVGHILMNPSDFENDLLSLKSISLGKLENSKRLVSVPILTDPDVPIGVVIAISRTDDFAPEEDMLGRCFAIADLPEKFKTYLHVGNSGVTFSVWDSGYGPEIRIESSAFGNIVNTSVVYTNTKSLKKIGEMLIEASQYEYSKEYVHSAKCPSTERFRGSEDAEGTNFKGEFG